MEFDNDLLAAVCSRLRVRRAVLFGSRAHGAPPPDESSDLDLAISLDGSGPRESFSDYFMGLGSVFPTYSLDLAFLADADPLFRWEVMRDGVLLWGDPIAFLEYRAFAFRDFVDSADLRLLERRLSEKKMRLIRRRLNAAA